MPDFPLDHIHPLEWVGSSIENTQTFIRDSWIAFNNDAPQLFERGTAIVTRVAPNILALMPGTSAPAMPTDAPVVNSWVPGVHAGAITSANCRRWCDMQRNANESGFDWATPFEWMLFVLLMLLMLILLLYRCCSVRPKTADKGTGTDPDPDFKQGTATVNDNAPEPEPAGMGGIENLQKRLAQQEKDCDEEKTNLRKLLAKQEEDCNEEKSELLRDLVQARKDNDILKLELEAVGPSATGDEKETLINAQRDQLKTERAALAAERGHCVSTINQNRAKSAEQIEKLERALVETKEQLQAAGGKCDEEKQLLRDQLETAYRDLQLTQRDLLGQLEQIQARSDVKTQGTQTAQTTNNQSTQIENRTEDQESQTEDKSRDRGTQTLVDQQTQTTASVATQTTTSTGTSPALQIPSAEDQRSDSDRMVRLRRENLSLQKQYDNAQAHYDQARGDVARLRKAHDEHVKYQITLADLLASSKIVEQNVKEINERCPHGHAVCAPVDAAITRPLRSFSKQGYEPDVAEIGSADEEADILNCDSTRCHKCPWYLGEKHHICVKSNPDSPSADNNQESAAHPNEENLVGKDGKAEREDLGKAGPKPLVPRVPNLEPAPPVFFPPSSFGSRVTANRELPSAIDFLQGRLGEYKVPLTILSEAERRRRFQEIRDTLLTDFNKFQAEAQGTRCSGKRHSDILAEATHMRGDSRGRILSKEWTPEFDVEDFQIDCKETVQTWSDEHRQSRKHLPNLCSPEDVRNSAECLPADSVDPADPEEAAEPKPGLKGLDSKRPRAKNVTDDELNSFLGSKAIRAPTPAKVDDNKKGTSDTVIPGQEDQSLEKPASLAPSEPSSDPKATDVLSKPTKSVPDSSSGGTQATIKPKIEVKQPKSPTKRPSQQTFVKPKAGEEKPNVPTQSLSPVKPALSTGPSSKQAPAKPKAGTQRSKIPTRLSSSMEPSSTQVKADSTVAESSSTVPPARKDVDKLGQSRSKKTTGITPSTQKPIIPSAPSVDPALIPPSLPLPFQESDLDAVRIYEAERGHEFTRLITSGSGFLCGVNAVELTTANMHPEIQGLTAGALMEVLDWREYRAIVDDPRFTCSDDLGQSVSPTNRTFFAVDQLASMIGLWGSRRGLDLRLGVNREDYGPFVYGGVRQGRTVVLWIHHDNNEERSRGSPYPMADHFSGYKRVPADTVDEAQVKKDAADKQEQDLCEADTKAKQDMEARSQRNAEFKEKQDADDQSKKDAEAISTQDRKNIPAAQLFPNSKPSAGSGFNPPPPPPLTNIPLIDFSSFKFSAASFNPLPEDFPSEDPDEVNPREAKRFSKDNAQVKAQSEDKAEQEPLALAGASNADSPDEDMADAPDRTPTDVPTAAPAAPAAPADVDMASSSESSDASDYSSNVPTESHDSGPMDVDGNEEAPKRDVPPAGTDSVEKDWTKLNDADLSREVREDQAKSHFPPPSQPYHLSSGGGNTPAPTGNRTPKAPVTDQPYVNPSPGWNTTINPAPSGSQIPGPLPIPPHMGNSNIPNQMASPGIPPVAGRRYSVPKTRMKKQNNNQPGPTKEGKD